MWEHKNHRNPKSFTAQYKVHKLVYYNCSDNPQDAIAFEKQLKAGSRVKKKNLINEMNPLWMDLSEEIGLDGVWME
jgi:putative endonuclease